MTREATAPAVILSFFMAVQSGIRCPDWRPLQFSIFFFRRIGANDDFAGGENRRR
jgi:hypothetical protein